MNDQVFGISDELNLAAQKGDLDSVKTLVEEGANIHDFDVLSKTALHYAVESGHKHLVFALIEMGADVNAHDKDNSGDTPIIVAAREGDFVIAKLLLQNGADPFIKGWMQADALHHATQRKDDSGEKVRSLIFRFSS